MLSSCAPSKPVVKGKTFSVLITDMNARVDWGADDISKEIKRRTGVELDIEIIDTDMKTKLASMKSLDEYPDMIFSVDNDIISQMASQDLLVPLDKYITPDTNIHRIFGDDLKYMRSETDGMIYGVNRAYQAKPSNSDALIFVQYAVLEHFGYPDVRNMTLDELHVMLSDYKNEFKYINNTDT